MILWSKQGGIMSPRRNPEDTSPKEYIPPVGPGSKSLPPAGSYRDLDPSLVQHFSQKTAKSIGKIANKK